MNCTQEAKARWREMISSGSKERGKRNAKWERLWADVVQTATEAFDGAKPIPMIVSEHLYPALSDNAETEEAHGNPAVKQYFVSDGVCGYAWLEIHPANCAFANFLKKKLGESLSKGYHGGLHVSSWNIMDESKSVRLKQKGAAIQSLARNEDAVRAACQILRSEGIDARPRSRID